MIHNSLVVQNTCIMELNEIKQKKKMISFQKLKSVNLDLEILERQSLETLIRLGKVNSTFRKAVIKTIKRLSNRLFSNPSHKGVKKYFEYFKRLGKALVINGSTAEEKYRLYKWCVDSSDIFYFDLYNAVDVGNVEKVKELLNSKKNPNVYHPIGNHTPLHLAIQRRQLSITFSQKSEEKLFDTIIELLLDNKSDPNLYDYLNFNEKRSFPLYEAALNRDVALFTRLVKAGGQPNRYLPNTQGKSKETIDEMLVKNVTLFKGWETLHGYIEQGLYDLNRPLSRKENVLGEWLLKHAIKNKNIAMFEFVIKNKNINLKNPAFIEMFFNCIEDSELKFVQLFLEKDPSLANIIKDRSGSYPIFAVKKGDVEMMQLLDQHQANFMQRGLEQHTVLHQAVMRGDLRMVEFLREKNELLNAMDDSHHTPLHFAISSYEKEILICLLRAGANPHQLRNSKNLFCFFGAIDSKGHAIESAEALIKAGANINCGLSPLFHALMIKNHSLIEWLLNQEIDLNAKNSEGKTAAQVAAEMGLHDIAQQLNELTLAHTEKM